MSGQEKIDHLGGSVGGEGFQSPVLEDDTIPFLVMSVSGETFAVEVEKVREVIRVPKLSWVPGAYEAVRGIINLRGSIIAVLDLSHILGLSGDPEVTAASRIVVIESGRVMVGLLVDAVSEVIDLPPASLEQTMRTLADEQRSAVVSQTTVRDRIVGVLDIDHVIEEARDRQSRYT